MRQQTHPDQAPDAADAAAERHLSELEGWLAARLATEEETLTLPRTGRRYTVLVPSAPDHDRLFAEAKATPDSTLPYWAEIWPSGVALADVAIARAPELVGVPVLELGCGLGVTAVAALAAGADLYVGDYSPISLALCGYNGLRNTGRAPHPLEFNWRDPLPTVLAQLEGLPGFSIIMAADILYESRDIVPVLELIDRLLLPDGVLWLAEPGRKTARRFLNTAAAAGWRGYTERATGPWPGGKIAEVGVHFLERPTGATRWGEFLGGWRT